MDRSAFTTLLFNNTLNKSMHPRNVGVYEGCFSAYLNKTFKFVSKMPGKDRI